MKSVVVFALIFLSGVFAPPADPPPREKVPKIQVDYFKNPPVAPKPPSLPQKGLSDAKKPMQNETEGPPAAERESKKPPPAAPKEAKNHTQITAAKENHCSEVLQSAGATKWFGPNVGHGIHSLTVQELQKFDPSARENNHIPTINMDLASQNPILPNAPDNRGPDDDRFVTEGMRALDYVLSNMDKEDSWDIKGFTTLERVVHIFHMKEAWARALVQFQKIKTAPPSTEVCACALNVDENGIMTMLRYSALAIREPKLIYGQDPSNNDPGYYIQYNYQYIFKANKDLKTLGEEILKTKSDAMPHLTNAAEWKRWKDVGHMDPGAAHDIALYLYCALNNNIGKHDSKP